jgi:putative hemolysin
MIWMPNPASVYCEEQWWKLNIVEDAEWNQSGICKLADGTEVEEWEYYRANHTEEESWETTNN